MSATADQYSLFYEGCIIMGAITEYLISITAAVLVCAAAKYLMGDKTPIGKLVKVICGVFTAITVISPLTDFKIQDITDKIESYISYGDGYVLAGTEYAEKTMEEIIKQQIETYILDEADKLSADIQASVTLCLDRSYMPHSVKLSGAVSPYQKKLLSEYMEDTLGIAKENQQWT